MTSVALGALLILNLAVPQQETPPTEQPATEIRQLVAPNEPVSIPGMSRINAGGPQYLVLPNGNIGPQVPADGTWSGVANLPDATPALTGKIRIYILGQMGLVGPDMNGNPVVRRSNISALNEDQIRDAITLFKKAVSNLSHGAAQVEVDLQEDQELLLFEDVPFNAQSSEGTRINQWIIDNIVLPKTNVYPFESDDPTDYGPFDFVVALHPGLTEQVTMYAESGRNVLVLPYFSAKTSSTANLASHLLATWINVRPECTVLRGQRAGETQVRITTPDDASNLVSNAPKAANFQPGTSGAGMTQFNGNAPDSNRPVDWLGYEPFTPAHDAQAYGSFATSTEDNAIVVSQLGAVPTGFRPHERPRSGPRPQNHRRNQRSIQRKIRPPSP